MSTLTVLAKPVYHGEFATIHPLGDGWGWQFTTWRCGRPVEHIQAEYCIACLLAAFEQGFSHIATPAMQEMFEQDVILAGE